MARTYPPIPEALDAAIRLGKRDLPAAVRAATTLRRRAIRLGDSRGATACLVALQMFARASGNGAQEHRLARKLVAARGAWIDFYILGRLRQSRGDVSEARSLYDRALAICPKKDPDRDQIVTALATLQEGRPKPTARRSQQTSRRSRSRTR